MIHHTLDHLQRYMHFDSLHMNFVTPLNVCWVATKGPSLFSCIDTLFVCYRKQKLCQENLLILTLVHIYLINGVFQNLDDIHVNNS